MAQIDVVVPDGSMQEVVVGLFAKDGLPIVMENRRTKEGRVQAEWIRRVAFQRPQEIPQYLNSGHFDVAIVGEDWIANWGYTFPVLLKMPMGRAGNKPIRIVLAVSNTSGIERLEDLPKNSEVATEFVGLAQRYFKERNRPDLKVIPSFGNTEHKIRFGATAIIDITESGESLRENQLQIIAEIMESSTVIVANSDSLKDEAKAQCIDYFVRLMNGAFQASKHILLTANVPKGTLDAAVRIIGGLKGPSCSPLTGVEGWFALQSVVRRENEQKIIFELLKIGVTDIIVTRDVPLIMS